LEAPPGYRYVPVERQTRYNAPVAMPIDPDSPVVPDAPQGRRLDSWKEIAEYLHRGLSSVQRWEREEGLPVRRHVHTTGGSVFAYTRDLDEWLAGRDSSTMARTADQRIPVANDSVSPEAPGGAMPLESPFYIVRAADDALRQAIARRTSIVLVKGPRQVGKSSLLARALADARLRRAAVAFTDIQAFGGDDLRSAATLYQALGRSLADQVKVTGSILHTWNDNDSPNTNFSRYVQRSVLSAHPHLVWGLDEVDRLVGREYAVDVFGLFRSWHNRRALDPAAPWARLTLAIAYATEAHLLIADFNQSPFNVGVRLTLDDFDAADVAALNDRYGCGLDGAAIDHVMSCVGGHPYLLQCAFAALRRGLSIEQFEAEARREIGALGEHLRRLRVVLQGEPALQRALDAVLRDGVCPDRETFYRLRSAGLIHGTSPTDAVPRCALYRQLMSGSV
jgi:AAA-like domain